MARIATIDIPVQFAFPGGVARVGGQPRTPARWEMNRSGDAAEILLYREIGSYDWDTGKFYGAESFVEQLAALGDVATIDVRINSVGGIASEAHAMYQALARHAATKRVFIDAACYSAATIIAMAASPGELRIAFNARMMIHNAWNVCVGDHNDMQKECASLQLLDGTIAATYDKRSSVYDKQAFLDMMNAETWFDAEAAVAAGLADQVFAGDEAHQADETNLARRLELCQAYGMRLKNPPANLLEGRGASAPTPAAAAAVEARFATVQACEVNRPTRRLP